MQRHFIEHDMAAKNLVLKRIRGHRIEFSGRENSEIVIPQFINDCISFDGFDFIAKYKMVPPVSVLLEVVFSCLYLFKSKYANLTLHFSRKLTFLGV